MTMEARRSGNYEASTWANDYIQSLTTQYHAKGYVEQAEKLKKEVKTLIEGTLGEVAQLELIDNLQRLDVSCHFGDTLQKQLEKIYNDKSMKLDDDLHHTALKFRMLRQHGYHVPQEVFSCFMDDTGNFETGLADDVKGLLSLYEASYLSVEGEAMLDSAKDFSTRHLAKKLEQFTTDDDEQIRHALELPLHWRVQKLEAIWFMHVYQNRPDANLPLLEFAKLNFNIVQAKYQDELKHISRRYNENGLVEKMSFVRDRLAECFVWAVGTTAEPHFKYTREIMTLSSIMITVIDDIYDVYGTFEEIELFTKFIERWDINELDRLPLFMQICFLDLNNFVNEMASRVLKEQGLNIISNLRKLWIQLCKDYYLEAKWFHIGYFPTTNEYLNNGWRSIGAPIALMKCYFCITNPINQQELKSLEQYSSIIRSPSMVVRLVNDFGTSSDEMKKGDFPKSIQCYMHETGCSEAEARKYIMKLIEEYWKKMNKDILMSGEPFHTTFGPIAMNLARISIFFYHRGDGFANHSKTDTKKIMVSLFVEPMA